MAQETATVPEVGDYADHLRIVLFGMPAAGKSSLLGALNQAAQTQEHLLNGRLTDLTQGLGELQLRLYEGVDKRTVEEVVPYPVEFLPFAGDSQEENGKPWEAVVIDCDGRVANDLLIRRAGLPEDSPEGTLAHEVANADALILVVDAAAPTAQIEADFSEFDRFLRHMERRRGQQAEVGGLPVFLTLTKCDLLARDGDTTVDWVERIEERKREVDSRFRKFLARRQQEAGPLPFGQIDLHLWATAVKRPPLAGNPARPREPYGVAELFRLALEEGQQFEQRQRQAGRRLWWTVGVAGTMVALLLSLIVYQMGRPTPETNPLEYQVSRLRSEMPSEVAKRLDADEATLEMRRDDLAAIVQDPDFESLSEEDRQWVQSRLEEVRKYLSYLQLVTRSRRPGAARSIAEVGAIAKELEKNLAPPEPQEWKGTPAVRLHDQFLEDAQALERAAKRALDWYQVQTEQANQQFTFINYRTEAGINWRGWDDAVGELLSSDGPPFRPTDVIPGSPSQLTYSTALNLEEVRQAQIDLQVVKANVARLRKLAAALGLAPPSAERPAVLVIPRNFPLDKADERVRQLKEHYPDHEKEFFGFLPDMVRPAVRQAARTNYEALLEPARARILQELKRSGVGDEETRRRWERVRDWLKSDPRELVAWRVLAGILGRLAGPEAAEDPVKELVAFLDRPSFRIAIDRIQLVIPDRLGIQPERGADLKIYHKSTQAPAIRLKLSDTQRHLTEEAKVYTFRPEGTGRLEYRPGDEFWAELALHGDRVLTWARAHSTQYLFERLVRPPWLHSEGEPTTRGKLVENVEVLISPPDGIPEIPDLLPVVRLGG
jgi:GTPase SAR1 family protein